MLCVCSADDATVAESVQARQRFINTFIQFTIIVLTSSMSDSAEPADAAAPAADEEAVAAPITDVDLPDGPVIDPATCGPEPFAQVSPVMVCCIYCDDDGMTALCTVHSVV